MDTAVLEAKINEFESFRIKLSSRIRELQEELQDTEKRLRQHEGAIVALQDILKGINANP